MQVTDRQFNTALHLASRDGLHDLIRLLVDPPRQSNKTTRLASDDEHVIEGQKSMKAESTIAGLDVNIKSNGGVTALMLATRAGHANVVLELLKVGADPDLVDRHRATALVYALMTVAFNEPCPAIVKTLIRHNCDVNKAANIKEMCKFWSIPTTVLR